MLVRYDITFSYRVDEYLTCVNVFTTDSDSLTNSVVKFSKLLSDEGYSEIKFIKYKSEPIVHYI